MCAKISAKKINIVVVGDCQSFQFFKQKAWFLEIIDICLNLNVRFCITWLVLPNYKKISP